MPDKLATYKLPDDFACPVCDAVLIGASPVTGGAPRGFHKGHLSICAYCGSILVLGDSMYEKITDEQLEKLDSHTRNNLKMIVANILKRLRDGTKDN